MIRTITIVGGGTSGWWCAAYIRKFHPDISITLIESPNIPTIGVGESTMPNVKSFFDELEINEHEWMNSCSAVKKTGNIKSGFKNKFDEPYNFMFINKKFDNWFIKYKNKEVDKFSLYNLYDLNEWRSYGYHIDAANAWQIVKKYTSNINHIIKHVEPNDLPKSDLYIDCTGFQRLLIPDKTLHVYPDTLVNSCIVRRINEPTKSYTESKACDYGWEFNVYLSDDRVGCGYVFDKNMITVDQAKQEYMTRNKNRNFLSDFKLIEWSPGRLKYLWQDNIVAIGLSSGFIDPLEANSLSLLVHQIKTLSKVINKSNAKEIYNRAVSRVFNQVADYIWHHYACTSRNDTDFWKYYASLKSESSLFERIEKNINLEQNLYPSYVYAYLGIYYGLI